MPEKVVFYQLTHKFLNKDQALPEGPRQVMYYSLAIGHHVGVMDCFQPMMELPLDAFLDWMEKLPEGTARHKLEGILRWGEIEINQSHASALHAALLAAMPDPDSAVSPVCSKLLEQLAQMEREPALYLMVRRVPA
jgi:hydrogenase-4 component J